MGSEKYPERERLQKLQMRGSGGTLELGQNAESQEGDDKRGMEIGVCLGDVLGYVPFQIKS